MHSWMKGEMGPRVSADDLDWALKPFPLNSVLEGYSLKQLRRVYIPAKGPTLGVW